MPHDYYPDYLETLERAQKAERELAEAKDALAIRRMNCVLNPGDMPCYALAETRAALEQALSTARPEAATP